MFFFSFFSRQIVAGAGAELPLSKFYGTILKKYSCLNFTIEELQDLSSNIWNKFDAKNNPDIDFKVCYLVQKWYRDVHEMLFQE